MRPRIGDKHTFGFFKDDGGRLRARWEEKGETKPVVSAKGKRYAIARLFGIEEYLSNDDVWELQLAEAGDTVIVTIV